MDVGTDRLGSNTAGRSIVTIVRDDRCLRVLTTRRGVAARPVAADEREPATVSGTTGEHHEHEDTSNHTDHRAGSGWWRLLWPGALVLGYGVQERVTELMGRDR